MLRRAASQALNILVVPYDIGTMALAGFAFATPFLASSPDDPTNEAGIYAALVALCMAGLIFSESVRWIGPLTHRFRRPAIALCAIGSSYLWLVDETGSDPTRFDLPTAILPTRFDLPTAILVVWLMALVAIAIPFIVVVSRPRNQLQG